LLYWHKSTNTDAEGLPDPAGKEASVRICDLYAKMEEIEMFRLVLSLLALLVQMFRLVLSLLVLPVQK
jgi:hypothetical protein